MPRTYPERLHVYNSAVVDGARWDRYAGRSDDIFICTPPKCGTTWMQAIVALLIFGRPDLAVKPGIISPWFDANFTSLEDILTMMEAQTHRRSIKTHTPLDGIPFQPGCKHIAVYRDPRDVYFSWRTHVANLKSDITRHRLDAGPNEGFRDWCRNEDIPGETDGFALARFVHHYKTYKAFDHLDEIHLLHYADMKRDLPGAMREVSGILDIETPEPLLRELAAAADFDNMKQKAEQFAPDAGTLEWRSKENFFSKGSNAQWRKVLTREDLAIYNERMAELLPAEQIAWLENGDG